MEQPRNCQTLRKKIRQQCWLVCVCAQPIAFSYSVWHSPLTLHRAWVQRNKHSNYLCKHSKEKTAEISLPDMTSQHWQNECVMFLFRKWHSCLSVCEGGGGDDDRQVKIMSESEKIGIQAVNFTKGNARIPCE